MTKGNQRLFISILCILMLSVMIFSALPMNKVCADSGYYIKNYDVEVKVNSDRTYDITETIDVYFTEESHGIIRDIPTWASEEREVRLQNVVVEGTPFEYDGYGEIRIGDADEYVKGDVRYVIKYTLWHYADEEPDYDYMYFNIIGTEWDTYIENFTSTITLPEDARINDITLTAGYYGETFDDYADYSVNGNVINIESKKSLDAYEGITINVQMLEGAFADAQVWKPDLYIHSINADVRLNDEGVLNVKQIIDVTVNYPSGLSIDLKDRDEDYNAEIGDVTVTYPSGRVDKTQSGDEYCFIDLYDYETQRITVTLEYDKTYYVRDGQSAITVEQMLLPADSEIIVDDVTVNVNMPFIIDEYSVKLGDIYDYYYNNYDQEINVTFSDDGKSAVITLADDYDSDNYSYICFGTEQGYFYSDDYSTGTYAGIGALITAGLAIVLIFTKRTPKYVPIVEFYPPDGLTPAEMGYIIDTRLSKRDMVSMIYYWAAKGFLDIVFISNKDFYLRYKKPLSNHKPFEFSLFNGLWLSRDTATLSDLKNRYYKFIDSAMTKIINSYGGAGSLISKSRNVLSAVCGVIIPTLFMVISGIYSLIFLGESAQTDGFAIVMMLFFIWLTYRQGNKIHQNKIFGLKNIMNILRLITAIIAMLFISFAYPLLTGGFLFSDVTAFFIGLTMSMIIFFASSIKRRSEWGEELLNKTLGFRMFLETAEKTRLQLLLDENPQYFYDILPYAQVLGLTKKWIKRFDGIAVPPPTYLETYNSGNSIDINSFDRVYSNLYSAMKSMPSSSSSGGHSSGGGGGFSSGGGGFSSGGSSGGGSGGGGGSRW